MFKLRFASNEIEHWAARYEYEADPERLLVLRAEALTALKYKY